MYYSLSARVGFTRFRRCSRGCWQCWDQLQRLHTLRALQVVYFWFCWLKRSTRWDRRRRHCLNLGNREEHIQQAQIDEVKIIAVHQRLGVSIVVLRQPSEEYWDSWQLQIRGMTTADHWRRLSCQWNWRLKHSRHHYPSPSLWMKYCLVPKSYQYKNWDMQELTRELDSP